jgi:hypothetical protein
MTYYRGSLTFLTLLILSQVTLIYRILLSYSNIFKFFFPLRPRSSRFWFSEVTSTLYMLNTFVLLVLTTPDLSSEEEQLHL